MLISDLGGVVVAFSFEHAYRSWAGAGGVARDDLHALAFEDDHYRSFEVGAVDVPQFLDGLRESLGLDLTRDQLATGWNAIFEGLVEPILDLYRELSAAGTRIVGLTNTTSLHRSEYTRLYGDRLDEVFDRIYASDVLGARKPDPDAFRAVLDAEALDPSQAVFLDDNQPNVEGARAVGIDAYLFTSAEQARRDLRAAGLPA